MANVDRDQPERHDLTAMDLTRADWDREWAAAAEAGQVELPDETAVTAARYDRPSHRIVIDLAGGMTILVPAAKLQALSAASPDELSEIEILGRHMLDWPRIDQQVYLPDLLKGITGTRTWMAAQLGRKGGAVRSSAKAAASRVNGKNGGRPRKTRPASGS